MAKRPPARLPVAVLILNWNGKALSEACLASWQRARPAPLRILLVDNGSQDGSVAYLKRRFKGVEFLALKSNLGFAAGNNRGFEHLWATGPGVEAVFVCNNDTEVETVMLGRLWSGLKRRRDWGVVGPQILFHGQTKVWFEGGELGRWTGWASHLRYGQPAGRAAPAFQLGPLGFVTGCGMLLRADALRALKGFDESYWAYAEDSDLCLRLGALGLGSGIVPSAVMSHKVSASFGEASPRMAYYATRNPLWLIRRHHLGAWPLSLLLQVAATSIRAVRYFRMGGWATGKAWFKGLFDGLFVRVEAKGAELG